MLILNSDFITSTSNSIIEDDTNNDNGITDDFNLVSWGTLFYFKVWQWWNPPLAFYLFVYLFFFLFFFFSSVQEDSSRNRSTIRISFHTFSIF